MDVLIRALVFCVLALPGQAQVMQQHSLVCDLMVNGYRVSWPPLALDSNECTKMAEDIQSKDATKAVVKCDCKTGSRT